MGQAEKKSAIRFFRGVCSLLISGAIAYATDKTYLVALMPLINSGGKWLREKFGLKFIPF